MVAREGGAFSTIGRVSDVIDDALGCRECEDCGGMGPDSGGYCRGA